VSSEESSPLEGATRPERSLRQTIAIAAFSLVAILAIYAYVGTRDRSLEIDHAALVYQQQVDGLICCAIYHEAADNAYLLVLTRELEGEFRQVVMRVMQMDEHGRPEEVNAVGSPFDSLLPTSVSMVEDILYVPLYGPDQAGVWTVDLSDPKWPNSSGFVATASGVSRQLTATEGGLAAINHTEEIVLLDISDPSAPEPVSRLDQRVSGFVGLELHDSRLYINDGDSDRIRIVELSDPTAPIEIGEHINPDGPGKVPIALGVLDAAERLDATAIPGRYLDFAVAGNLVYVAASELGLQVLDVSDSEDTHTVATLETPDRAIRVALAESGDRLYALGGSEEDRDRLSYAIHVIEISDPANPAIIETIDDIVSEPGLQAFTSGGDYVFVGLNETLLVFDVGD
jgi:hypothetical protein